MRLKIPLSAYFVGYFILLIILYVYKIKSHYYWGYVAYLQESFFDFSWSRFLTAIFIFLINLYVIVHLNKKRFIFIVLSIFFLLLTIPSLIAFTSQNMYPARLLWYHQLLFFGLWIFSKVRLNFNGVPVLNKKQALLILFLVIIIGAIPYLMVYGPHIDLRNLLLLNIYETRTKMAGLSNAYFGYTYSPFTKILIPLLIVFSLELKNKLLTIVGAFYLVLFYLFGAHKTVYLGLVVVLVFYWWSYLQSIKRILLFSILLLVVSFVLALPFIGDDRLWTLTFRRVHFLPTLLDICYIDFFSDKPLYWSESVLKRFIEYPYQVNHQNLIGEAYFNRVEVSANNGLVSDGFMNMGGWGVAINVFMVAVYFMILNSLKIPSRYFGLYLLVIFSFISSSTLTVFMTHGALVLLLVSVFLINEKKNSSP